MITKITSNTVHNTFKAKLPQKSINIASISACGRLDKNSKASIFFGVENRENLLAKIENHINLVLQKSKDLGFLPSFPKRAFFSINKPETIINAWNHIWTQSKGRKFEELIEHPARLTFDGDFFGINGKADSHTIGIMYEPKTKTLFCLDSLSNLCKQVKEYQDILINQIFNSPNGEIKKIIFSNKYQQGTDEYTCNNWALANIEALQKALRAGKDIDNTEKLNAVLPEDINEILKKQYEYLLKRQ